MDKQNKKANQEKQKKDLHRLERESKNSPQQFHDYRQPQSLLSSAQVLRGWPEESKLPCFAEGEVKILHQCGVLQKEPWYWTCS
jgi:hypothetical protein